MWFSHHYFNLKKKWAQWGTSLCGSHSTILKL